MNPGSDGPCIWQLLVCQLKEIEVYLPDRFWVTEVLFQILGELFACSLCIETSYVSAQVVLCEKHEPGKLPPGHALPPGTEAPAQPVHAV